MTFSIRAISAGWLLLGLGLFPGCSSAGGTLPEEPNTSAEIWPDPDWAVSTPEAAGIDPAAIDSLISDIEAGSYGLVDHFLLIRYGRIVAERHFEQDYAGIAAGYDTRDHQYNYDHPNWHPYYQGSDLHTLQSVTKSVTSAALGIALDEGMIEGVRAPVLPFFESYSFDRSDPRKQRITLEDLLTMRTGIAWFTDAAYGTGKHTTDLLEASDAWIQFILDQPMDAEPGTTFEYNDGSSVLIGRILRAASGQRADEWAAERLFKPLGIKDFYWKITPDGEADTEGGLYLAPHDLARIGYLFLRGGRWKDRQIISRSWVEASTAPTVKDVAPDNDGNNAGYGYQWWMPDHDGSKARIFAANGYGGQFVLVAPGVDIVCVFNGWNIHDRPGKSTYAALSERIIPALRK